MPKQAPGLISLFGSGELSDTMAETHRLLMARLQEPVNPVFIDTPAGFELNIDSIDHKAITYFERNFGLTLTIARYRTPQDSTDTIATAVNAIRRGNYIFAGPGSPSYAVRIWKESKVWSAVLDRWREGAMLVFASGAAVTLGQLAIPVYEIYKCGQDVAWIEGLDVLGEAGIRAVVVPHWNNNSGNQYDTRFCFMGAPRLAMLETQVPSDSMVIGVDEYTALCIDPTARTADVTGAGEVTIRQNGRQLIYSKGQQFSVTNAVSEASTVVPLVVQQVEVEDDSEENDDKAGNADVFERRAAVETAIASGDFQSAVDGVVALTLIANAGVEQSVYNRAELALQALQTTMPLLHKVTPGDAAATEQERDALIKLILTAREELRKAKLWATADQLRDELIALGFTLSDTPEGTSWQRA